MTEIQILKQVFEKAGKNGYNVNLNGLPLEKVIEYGIYYKFIFNHDFAKAFFTQTYKGGKLIVDPNYYLTCLSELAREKEPIKYLKKFI